MALPLINSKSKNISKSNSSNHQHSFYSGVENEVQGPNLFQQLKRKVDETKKILLYFDPSKDEALDFKSKMTSIDETWSNIQKLVKQQHKIIDEAHAALTILRDPEEDEEIADVKDGEDSSDDSFDVDTKSIMPIDDLAEYFLVCVKIQACRRFYSSHKTFPSNNNKKQKTIIGEYPSAMVDTNGDFEKLDMIEYRVLRILNHECQKRKGKEEKGCILSVNLIYDKFYKSNPPDILPNWKNCDIVKVWDRVRLFSTSNLNEKRGIKQDLEKGPTEIMEEAQAFINSIEVDHLMSFLPPDQFIATQSDSHRKLPDCCIVCGAKAEGDKVYCRDDCLVKDLALSSTSEETVS